MIDPNVQGEIDALSIRSVLSPRWPNIDALADACVEEELRLLRLRSSRRRGVANDNYPGEVI